MHKTHKTLIAILALVGFTAASGAALADGKQVNISSNVMMTWGKAVLTPMPSDASKGSVIVYFGTPYSNTPSVTLTPELAKGEKEPADMKVYAFGVNAKAITIRGAAGMTVNYMIIGPK